MQHLFRILSALIVGAAVSSCNPVKADASNEILGRWQSPKWRYGDSPVYVEFTSDGKAEYLSSIGFLRSTWTILPETGELKITYPSGSSPPRCKFSISGNTLTIEQTACLDWKDLGPSIVLEKK